MRKSRRSALAAVCLAALLGIAAAGSASAVGWGPLSSTYNGSTVVKGSGTFTNYGSAVARTSYTITDSKADGNTVFGQTTGYIWGPYNGTDQWIYQGSKATAEHQNATKSYETAFGLTSTGTKARGGIQACAQMGWPVPNSCSASAYPSFNY